MKKKFLKTLFIATENPGKFKEFKDIFESYNLKINFFTIKDFKNYNSPEEVGRTYYENALIKVKKAFEISKMPSIADDSGLEVDYLDGLPGVFSKRFYNDSGDFDKNIEKLLGLMKEVPLKKRKARFKCVLIYKDDIFEKVFEGVLEGFIWFEKRGINGFGYDPIFYIPKLNKTIGELTTSEKNKISHRFKAVSKLIIFLKTNFLFE